MTEFDVPEDMEIEMVIQLQNIGQFLKVAIPFELKAGVCILACIKGNRG